MLPSPCNFYDLRRNGFGKSPQGRVFNSAAMCVVKKVDAEGISKLNNLFSLRPRKKLNEKFK